MKKGAQKPTFVCYCLQSRARAKRRYTYIGITNNMARRLRQHNKEITGGARYTSAHGPWRVLWKLAGFSTRRHVLQFEWAMKHRRKGGIGGPEGRARTLEWLLDRPRVTKSAPLLPAERLVLHVRCSKATYVRLAGITAGELKKRTERRSHVRYVFEKRKKKQL